MNADLGEKPNNYTFNNPTVGVVDFERMIEEVIGFINASNESRYSLIVGSDSEQRNGSAEFVSVVLVHRIGNFGRYFWHKEKDIKTYSLRDRIYKEALFSIDLAQKLLSGLKDKIDLGRFNFEIHIDVGENGPTKEMIKEVVGMVKGNGFEAKIKPDAYGATKVADKHV